MAWIPLVTNYQEGQLFIYVTAVNGYIAPPFCAVLLLAMFVPRVNEKVRATVKTIIKSDIPNTHIVKTAKYLSTTRIPFPVEFID